MGCVVNVFVLFPEITSAFMHSCFILSGSARSLTFGSVVFFNVKHAYLCRAMGLFMLPLPIWIKGTLCQAAGYAKDTIRVHAVIDPHWQRGARFDYRGTTQSPWCGCTVLCKLVSSTYTTAHLLQRSSFGCYVVSAAPVGRCSKRFRARRLWHR